MKKMNHLNSSLLEGYIVDEPKIKRAPTGNTCVFTIASRRLFKTNEGLMEELSNIDIQTTGRLAETIYAKAHKDREVRIVGSITQDRLIGVGEKKGEVEYLPRLYIVAEHIELKPELKSGNNNDKENE